MSSFTKLKSSKFVAFCLVGATSAAVDIVFLYIGVQFLRLHLFVAATLSFGLASINGYLLNKKFTFKESEGSSFTYLQFLIISIIGLGLTILLLHILTNYLLVHYLIAKVITIALVVLWNYFANAYMIKRKQSPIVLK